MLLRQAQQKAKPVIAKALDLLFPPQCFACASVVPEHGALCTECWRQIHFIAEPMCARCGLPFDFSIGPDALCGECLREAPPFAQARAVMRYDEHGRRLVLPLKYQDKLHPAPTYAQWMARAGGAFLPQVELIVPVPLSYRRFLRRRYNQAAVLACALGRHGRLPVIPDALTKRKHTAPQTSLSYAQRKENVRGTYAVNARHRVAVRGKTILLIDDVITTGATVGACAEKLLSAGAANVYALALARTVRAV